MRTLARPHDTSAIIGRLRQVRPDSTARWGRMSAHQMICHVADACRMATGEKPVSDSTGLLQRTLVKWIAIYAPLRWPPGIQTRPEIDQTLAGTPPAEFAQDVAELERLLERVSGMPRNFAWAAHPIFGRMSHRAWLRWGYVHLDHHLRQFGA